MMEKKAKKAKPTDHGFVKHDDDKPRVELLPPDALVEISKVLTHGAKKYSANNWCQGADWSRYIGATMRHMLAWAMGEDLDPESGISHLAHAGCCVLFLLSYQLNGLGTDDRIGHDIAAQRK